MPRERSPNRKKAFDLWRNSEEGISLKDIADQLGVSDIQIRQWKRQDKWDLNNNVNNNASSSTNNNVIIKNKKSGAPKGNKNAEKHGFFARIFPDDKETRDIVESINIKSPIEILWENIVIQYTAIARAQKLMFVRDHDDITRVLRRQKQSSGINSDSSEEEYELQFAWDKHATFLKAQSTAMKTLEGLFAQYEKMIPSELVTEEQQLKIAKMKAEIIKMKDNEGNNKQVNVSFNMSRPTKEEIDNRGDT